MKNKKELRVMEAFTQISKDSVGGQAMCGKSRATYETVKVKPT
jgi:hypothetical protein